MIEVQLTPQEVNAILQMIDKTQTVGVQSMRVLLALDAKLREAAQAQLQGRNESA